MFLRVVLVLPVLLATLVAPAVAGHLPPGGTFTDDNGNVHEGNIEAIVAEGITVGCNPPDSTRYCPRASVTRGQMAAFLTRALDLPAAGSAGFTDTRGHRFEQDIDRIAARGITTGCNPAEGGDRYCPDAPVSRGQMAAFVSRAFDLPVASSAGFTDTRGHLFEQDIDRIADAGITRGCNPPANDRYCPDAAVTRAQMASMLARALGLSPHSPPPLPEPGATSCLTGSDDPTGSFSVVPGSTTAPGSGTVWDVRVETEDGLGVDDGCFAGEVMRILNDHRGWGADGDRTFRRVDGTSRDMRVMLASPDTTDRLCHPLDTAGIYSCRNGELVVLNIYRWRNGASDFGDDLTTYRQYQVNHEVGHRIGRGHTSCPGSGEPAPVMVQQTKSTYGCQPNGWPLRWER